MVIDFYQSPDRLRDPRFRAAPELSEAFSRRRSNDSVGRGMSTKGYSAGFKMCFYLSDKKLF